VGGDIIIGVTESNHSKWLEGRCPCRRKT
jgi:hypothetical protein